MQAGAVPVLSPGGQVRANSLEYISRQLVYVALFRYGKRIEVWVVDRRPNDLEDLTVLNAAEEAGDVQLAFGLLLQWSVDITTFIGLPELTDEDAHLQAVEKMRSRERRAPARAWKLSRVHGPPGNDGHGSGL